MARWLLIALPVLLIIIIVFKISSTSDDLLTRLINNELEVRKEINTIDEKIKIYYKDKNKKIPEYLFLDEKQSSELRALVEERFYQEVRLSDIYEQLGDYYLDENYLLNSAKDNEYKRFYKSLSFSELNPEKLGMYLKNKNSKAEARRIVFQLVETRLIALGYYRKSAEAIVDKSSDFFKLKEDSNRNFLRSPFILLVSGDQLSHKLSERKNGKGYLTDYFHKRVKPSLHRKMGEAYYQLTKLTYNLEIEKEDRKELKIKKSLMSEKGDEILQIDETLKTPEFYSKLSEKELLLSLTAELHIKKRKESKIDDKIDKKFPENYDNTQDTVTTYTLSELYVYRFEKLNEYLKIFMLNNAMKRVQTITDPNISDAKLRKNYMENLNKYKLKALMLLGRIYYHYAYLTQDEMNQLKTTDINFGGNFNQRKDVMKYYLEKMIELYDNRIIAYISEKHKLYKKIHKLRTQVREELDSLNK